MSYILANEDGYVNELASISGWAEFALWAEQYGSDVIVQFINDGHTLDPGTLADALALTKPADPMLESIRERIFTAARDSKGVLIISDGTSDEEDAGNADAQEG